MAMSDFYLSTSKKITDTPTGASVLHTDVNIWAIPNYDGNKYEPRFSRPDKKSSGTLPLQFSENAILGEGKKVMVQFPVWF